MRVAALRRLNVLDTLPEQEFDDLTTVAAIMCEAPVALISLVDAKRQWFKSKIGLTQSETHANIRSVHTRSRTESSLKFAMPRRTNASLTTLF